MSTEPNYFDGIENAVGGARRLPRPNYGTGVAKVTRIESFRPQAGGRGFNVVAEGEIESHTPADGAGQHAPGELVQLFFCDLESKFPESSKGDLRVFLEAVTGGPITADLTRQAVQHNALAGRRVQFQASQGKPDKKNAGKFYTEVICTAIQGQAAPVMPAPAPASVPTPPAPAPAPAQSREDKARALGFAPHTDPAAAAAGWWFKGQDVKTLDQIGV